MDVASARLAHLIQRRFDGVVCTQKVDLDDRSECVVRKAGDRSEAKCLSGVIILELCPTSPMTKS